MKFREGEKWDGKDAKPIEEMEYDDLWIEINLLTKKFKILAKIWDNNRF
jgi:hypothetical protein